MGSVAWLVQIDQWVTEIDIFSRLPQATGGRGRRDTEFVYLGMEHCCKIGVFKLQHHKALQGGVGEEDWGEVASLNT